jgi:aminoglycoside phosphotransferase (APT) family kinase protein
MNEQTRSSPRVASVEEIRTQLAGFVAEHYGRGADLRNVGPMPGHAGLTFGFEVWKDGLCADSLVLRIPPKGVRRSGNTDVYRQAPLLRTLKALGLPVPGIPWADEDERWFGVPFIMMELLPGETCFPWDPQPVWRREDDTIRHLWRHAAAALAEIHNVDWQTHLRDWEAPQPIVEEIERWKPIYAQSPEPAWAETADEVRQLLLETMPADLPVGLQHGDFQIGNILFQDGRVSGIIDWELSCIGTHLMDLGWLLMFNDPESWSEKWPPLNQVPLDELRAIYEEGRGRPISDVDWYQAMACYRLGSITCLNVKLHRRGYRHDPVWENLGYSAPFQLGRARSLLLRRRSSGTNAS